ncbi:hypothetical protein [Streptomyces sp. NPDC003952]
MRAFLPPAAVTAAAALLVAVAGATHAAADRNPDGTPLVKVSHGDPYAHCTVGAISPESVVYPGTEVEPSLSVDPRDPKRVVTVYQQDRWNDGAARGLAASWSTDGHTFHRSTLPFSLCARSPPTRSARARPTRSGTASTTTRPAPAPSTVPGTSP